MDCCIATKQLLHGDEAIAAWRCSNRRDEQEGASLSDEMGVSRHFSSCCKERRRFPHRKKRPGRMFFECSSYIICDERPADPTPEGGKRTQTGVLTPGPLFPYSMKAPKGRQNRDDRSVVPSALRKHRLPFAGVAPPSVFFSAFQAFTMPINTRLPPLFSIFNEFS